MADLSRKAINELRHNARSVVRELGLLNDAYCEIGVTLAERHLLIELAGSLAPTMGEIAKRLLLDKSTVSRLIASAVKKGYIACITDGKDKRIRRLQMTEFGTQTLHAFEPIAFNQTKQALLMLLPEEIELVYQGVALYAKGLQQARAREKAAETRSNAVEIESLPEILSRLKQMGYTLRLFEIQDEQELYQIFHEVVESAAQFPYECSSIQEFRKQFFVPNGQVYVCESTEGEIVGGFFLRSNFSGRSGHIANAAYMMRSSCRGKGIGSLVIKASLHFAKELGFQSMQFNIVLSQNTRAIKLYQKLGFRIVGTVPDAFRNPDGTYQDGYIMHRKLL